MDKINRSDWAYLAGYFDGEGCITGSDYPRLDVYIDSCDKDILEWIQRMVGGTILTLPIRPPSVQQQYRWRMISANIIPTLKQMIPFLKLKQRQAYLAMAFRSCIEAKKGKRVLINLIKKIQRENKAFRSESYHVGRANKTAYAYLAGIVDADGCIYLSSGSTIRVKVVSNRLGFLRWLQFTFGGRACEGKLMPERWGKVQRPVHEWYLNKQASLDAIENMRPFLKRKHTLSLTDYMASAVPSEDIVETG